MKFSSLSVFIILFVIACASKKNNEQRYPSKREMSVWDSTSGNYIISTKEEKLIGTWETFKEAIFNADYKTLKKLSLDSIVCDKCVLLDHHSVISVDTFYNKYAQSLFTFLSSYISDSTKVKCTYGLDSSYFYAYPFLNTISDKTQPRLAIILVSYPITEGLDEGTSGMLGFLEMKKGYKFLGYSTIP